MKGKHGEWEIESHRRPVTKSPSHKDPGLFLRFPVLIIFSLTIIIVSLDSFIQSPPPESQRINKSSPEDKDIQPERLVFYVIKVILQFFKCVILRCAVPLMD